MSGGFFDYEQYKISEIADQVEQLIRDNNVEDEYGDVYSYDDEVIDNIKIGLNHLQLASIYAQRIDWFVSGDDGKESFLERLEEDLGNYDLR